MACSQNGKLKSFGSQESTNPVFGDELVPQKVASSGTAVATVCGPIFEHASLRSWRPKKHLGFRFF
jgi:hypothetical protein